MLALSAKAAVMRTYADRMTLDTVREDRGKALPGWKEQST